MQTLMEETVSALEGSVQLHFGQNPLLWLENMEKKNKPRLKLDRRDVL